jgi:hypothetical protein
MWFCLFRQKKEVTDRQNKNYKNNLFYMIAKHTRIFFGTNSVIFSLTLMWLKNSKKQGNKQNVQILCRTFFIVFKYIKYQNGNIPSLTVILA